MRAPRPRRRGVRSPGAVLALVALLTAGCRIDVATDVTVGIRGGGEVAVAVRIDGATLRELDAAGVDPALDVAATLGPDAAWTEERTLDADGGLTLTYRRRFADGEEATALLAELSADVAPQDPAVRLDVTVTTTMAGAVRIAGTGAVSPPATLGVRIDGEAVGPTGDELAALTADAVDATLRVTVPGALVEHDADVVEGRTLRWDLPVGEPRPILLVADAVPLWRRPSAVVAGLVTVVVAALLWRRTRRTHAPGGPAPDGASPDGSGPGVSPAG